MTFLELCKRVRQEAGIAGTGPDTVTGQNGELKRIVDWVASSWNDIQIYRPDWNWMSEDFSFSTIPGQRYYTAAEAGIASRFSEWHLDTVSLGTDINSEIMLVPMSFEEFRPTYVVGPQTQGMPVAVTSSPNLSLGFGHIPNQAYSTRGRYKKSPQTLTADSDVPEMPTQFHEAIMYLALKKYARYMAAPEIYQDADDNYKRIMNLLNLHQAPRMSMLETLA